VIDVVETHMSWVLLTDRHAFKLKKPVQLPYVDYRTLDLRRQSCERELRLGRRLAPDVYDAVLPVVQRGEIVDWLLAMRRLPHERMLPQMLARGAARPAHARALGDLLADFYRGALRAAWDGPEYRRRLSGLVTADGRELVMRGAAIEPLVGDVLAAIEREAAALDTRVAEGRIVDAHGDLRPEHVCFEARPLVIDPLEPDELRQLDAASELAFFSLECERLGARWFGDRVLARYRERSGDRPPAPLLALYRVQHALARALIALRHLDDTADPSFWRARCVEYLALVTPVNASWHGRDAAC
jgi:aminoglycoside phosphotransferase family enzyme